MSDPLASAESGPASLALIEDATDATRDLVAAMPGPAVAMSYAIHTALSPDLPQLTSPLEFQDAAEQQAQMAEVLAIRDLFSESLGAYDLSPAEVSLLTLRAIQAITLHVRVSRSSDHFGLPAVWVRNGEAMVHIASETLPAEVRATTPPAQRSARPLLTGPVSFLPEGCRIDLRTGQIRTGPPAPDAPLRVELRYAGKGRSRLRQCRANLQRIRRYRASGERVFVLDLPDPALTRHEAAIIDAMPDPALSGVDADLATALGRLVRVTVADIRSRVPDLVRLLRTHVRRIEGIDLNHVASGYHAAMLQAARTAGVPTRLFNHGNIIAHGDAIRRRMADLIARNSHNDHPDVTRIAPMSPYHVPAGCPADRVDRIVRVKPMVQAASGSADRPFRMLLAPNFLTWRGAFPGLVTTCYETMALTGFIAHKVAADPRFQLAIRVKTTVADEATLKTRLLKRGLVPENVEHLFGLADNIIDSNLGSYRQALNEADLIITEGMTKVIFEALEHRTPVLLLNLSSDRVPAAPGISLTGMQSDPQRHPIYHAACDDALMPLLEQVRARHLTGPLSDTELAPAIWTNA